MVNDFFDASSADKEDVLKVIQEGGEGVTEDRLKSTFEKLRPEIRYTKKTKPVGKTIFNQSLTSKIWTGVVKRRALGCVIGGAAQAT